jgi:hypothetical protein
VPPRLEFDAVLTSVLEEAPVLGDGAGWLADGALLLELCELPPHALTSRDAASTGMRNCFETRTLTLLSGNCLRFSTR